jgi:hypothetical protein
MIHCDNEALTEFLAKLDLEAVRQKETNQIYVIFKVNDQDFPLFFRIYEGDDQLQLLLFFPIQVPKERFDVLARLLHLLNKDLDVPGFGLDEIVGLVFHRIMIPVFNKKINQQLLETYISATLKICEQFFPVIIGATQSKSSFEEILKQSKP